MRHFNLILLFLLVSTLVNAQDIDAEGRLIYQAEEFKTGKFLKDFMMIGPFPNKLPEGVKDYFHLEHTCTGFSKDYLEAIGGETGVSPFIGHKVEWEGDSVKWFRYQSESDIIDLKKVFSPNDAVVSYAAIWIESKIEQEKILGVGSNDGIKAWFGGKQILKVHKPRTVSIDDEYLKLNLKPGKNLLLLKIGQGFGGWGFVLRPVDNTTAWKQVQKQLNVAMNSEFIVKDDQIIGTIGDNNIVGQLSNLPMAHVEFNEIEGRHSKAIDTPIGSRLVLSKSDFPGKEYAITISYETENSQQRSYAYMNTTGNMVEETRELFYRKVPDTHWSPLANYYRDFIETTRWLDQANKLWEHPYGYRRYFDGIKNARNGLSDLGNSNNPFKGVFPQPKEMSFKSDLITINGDWRVYDGSDTKDFINEMAESLWEGRFGMSLRYANKSDTNFSINLLIGSENDFVNTEGYTIEIEKKKIFIRSASRQGLFYGVNSLLQALRQNLTIPEGFINDYPSYPVRSVIYRAGKPNLNDDFKAYIRQVTDLRYNEVYVPANAYLELDDPRQLKQITDVMNYCKRHFIEPVPYFETFGSHTITRLVDQCLEEGIYHELEKHIVGKAGVIELDVPKIHDCEQSTVHVFDASEKELIRGLDYELISIQNPTIQILSEKYFTKEVYLSYDAVDFSLFPHPASCPTNPKGWEIQERVISSVLTKLKPSKIHISQDEVGFVNTCSLCKARNLTNREIMIDQIKRIYGIIRKYDPKVDIYIWGDMFNDLQNASKIGATGAIDGLPEDVMVYDWNYIAVYHSDKMQTINQMKFYLDKGYKTGGVAWFEPANVLDLLLVGEKYKDSFLGIMYAPWSGYYHGLLPTAEANWTGNTILNKLEF
ncbi:MAG: glycoside hydrolase family 20 zincin-like fold domain-containing protein [Bacteroidota bacterium]